MNPKIKSMLFVGLMLLSANSFAQPIAANQYQCEGKNITVDYSASSITGDPLLTITLNKRRFSARGDNIQTQQTVLGNLVTLVKKSTPDLLTDTLTVLLPDINVSELGRKITFTSQLIATRTRTSIGGPALVSGRIQLNTSLPITCTATSVVF